MKHARTVGAMLDAISADTGRDVAKARELIGLAAAEGGQDLLALPVVVNRRMRTRAGFCEFRRQHADPSKPLPTMIVLNAALWDESAEAVVTTFLHELAHALAGHAAGHGPLWEACARRIGGAEAAKRHHSFAVLAGEAAPFIRGTAGEAAKQEGFRDVLIEIARGCRGER